jgi:hypothetical protein
MSGTPASMMAQKPPIIPPTFPTACKTPNANPRLCVSVESATNDWMDGNASASPRPFSALQAAIWSQRKLICEENIQILNITLIWQPWMIVTVLHKPLNTLVHLLLTLTSQWFNHIKIYFKQWINEISIYHKTMEIWVLCFLYFIVAGLLRGWNMRWIQPVNNITRIVTTMNDHVHHKPLDSTVPSHWCHHIKAHFKHWISCLPNIRSLQF